MSISIDQIKQYHDEGFLMVENLITDQEVSDFLSHESKPKPEDWQKGLRTHTADPQWQYLATHPNITSITSQLLNGDPQIVQRNGKAAIINQATTKAVDAIRSPWGMCCAPDAITSCP